MAWPRKPDHVAWCQNCRRTKPIAAFPTADSGTCTPCQDENQAKRAARAKSLTPAQVSVAELMCLGKTNEEIGMILHRSPLTVKYAVRKLKEEI